jgi:small GTP-binding protein
MGKSIKLKLIVLGDQFSGKSSILNRYKNDVFIDYSVSTIGVDFVTKTIIKDDNEYILHIWDTSGQEKFNSIITSYYRNIVVALLVFDLSNHESFLNLKKWIDNIECYCNSNIIIKLIGNKCDKKVEVSHETILELCFDYKIKYIEVSAKENIGITEIFSSVIDTVHEKLTKCTLVPNNENGITITDTFNFDYKQTPKPEPKCCIIL